MQSKAATVAEYFASLPPDRRAELLLVRDAILGGLDPVYEEGMHYGMVCWCVPHRVFPDGYHCDPQQPLPFVALAAQKHYLSLYVMTFYSEGEGSEWFRKAWARSGKKLDMGRCCIRFRKAADLALDVVTEAIRRMPAKRYVAIYQQARAAAQRGKRRPAKRAATRK